MDYFLRIGSNGNVEMMNKQGIKVKVVYYGNDAQRADWIDEKDQTVQVQTTKGKIKIVNKQGIVVRTI